MAKYDVTHSCGHEQTHQLFGKMDSRYNRIAWMEKQPCDACQKEAVQSLLSEKNEIAREKKMSIYLVHYHDCDGADEILSGYNGTLEYAKKIAIAGEPWNRITIYGWADADAFAYRFFNEDFDERSDTAKKYAICTLVGNCWSDLQG
jgi:hypothetical protein